LLPIRGRALRLDFDRAVTLLAFRQRRREEAEAREFEVTLARSQAQMTAAMTWCKHEDTVELDEGGSECRACRARFS
jgi:hypothetical protein